MYGRGTDDPDWLYRQAGRAAWDFSIGCLVVEAIGAVVIGLGLFLLAGPPWAIGLFAVGLLLVAVARFHETSRKSVRQATRADPRLVTLTSKDFPTPGRTGEYAALNASSWTPMSIAARCRGLTRADAEAFDLGPAPRSAVRPVFDGAVYDATQAAGSNCIQVYWFEESVANVAVSTLVAQNLLRYDPRDSNRRGTAADAAGNAAVAVLLAPWLAPEAFDRLMAPWRSVAGDEAQFESLRPPRPTDRPAPRGLPGGRP